MLLFAFSHRRRYSLPSDVAVEDELQWTSARSVCNSSYISSHSPTDFNGQFTPPDTTRRDHWSSRVGVGQCEQSFSLNNVRYRLVKVMNWLSLFRLYVCSFVWGMGWIFTKFRPEKTSFVTVGVMALRACRLVYIYACDHKKSRFRVIAWCASLCPSFRRYQIICCTYNGVTVHIREQEAQQMLKSREM